MSEKNHTLRLESKFGRRRMEVEDDDGVTGVGHLGRKLKSGGGNEREEIVKLKVKVKMRWESYFEKGYNF